MGAWMRQLKEESMKADFIWYDALCRSRRIVGVNQISTGLRLIWPSSLVQESSSFEPLIFLLLCIYTQ